MEPELRAFLECRDQVDRAQVEFVLDAVGHGQHLPGLSDSLFDILYDCQMLPLKGMAVAAFVYHCTDDDYRSKKLQQLLADITTNNVEDWGDALAAVALRYLYPGPISPSTIWDHLTESKDQYAVDYCNFWRSDLVKRSTDAEVAALLDELAARGKSLKPALPAASMLAETGSTISDDCAGYVSTCFLAWPGRSMMYDPVLVTGSESVQRSKNRS